MIHDLSYPITDGMTTYPRPWHPRTEVVTLGRHAVEGRETRRITLGTHTGTHVDAPAHFVPGGNGVEAMDPAVLCGRARVVDLSDQRGEVGPNVLRDRIGNDRYTRILLTYGWRDLSDPHFYDNHPYLSDDAAWWLVDHGTKLLGMDTPSPDAPYSDGNPAHGILLDAGVVLVEYMRGLDRLPEWVRLTVAPLNIPGADGAPARCFAETEE